MAHPRETSFKPAPVFREESHDRAVLYSANSGRGFGLNRVSPCNRAGAQGACHSLIGAEQQGTYEPLPINSFHDSVP